MPNRGQIVPEWVNHKIKQIAIEIRDELGSLRYPTAIEVRERLRQYLTKRGDDVSRNLPGESHIRGRLRELYKKIPATSDIDSPWSLGKSDENHIPDEATGAILEVWAWSMNHPSADTLSIRTARWVSKLRWVHKAGGNPHGRVEDPEKLYHVASMYSGRERQVELIKDQTEKDNGMRRGVLDAHLMLDRRLQPFARRLGILEDDTGIGWPDDLSSVAPSWKAHLNLKYYVDRGERPEHDRRSEALAQRLDEFQLPEGQASTLLEMALKVLATQAPFRKLSAYQEDHFIEELLQDMMAAYKEGDVYSWNPYPKIMTLLNGS